MCVVRSGTEPGEADWKESLYSDTQHRPLQEHPSTFLAAQSMRGPADSDTATHPQPPYVQVGSAPFNLYRCTSHCCQG